MSPRVTAPSLLQPCLGWVVNEGEQRCPTHWAGGTVQNPWERRFQRSIPPFLLVLGEHSIVFVGSRVVKRAFHCFCWVYGCQGNIPLSLSVLGLPWDHSTVSLGVWGCRIPPFLSVLGFPEEHSTGFICSRDTRGEFHHFFSFRVTTGSFHHFCWL